MIGGVMNKKSFDCPEFVASALNIIESAMRTDAISNNLQWANPFDNTGSANIFDNGIFYVNAYDWSKEQSYNFKYGDIEISWYKRAGKDMTINRIVTHNEIADMIVDCVSSVGKKREVA